MKFYGDYHTHSVYSVFSFALPFFCVLLFCVPFICALLLGCYLHVISSMD